MTFEALTQSPPAALALWQADLAGLRFGSGTPYGWRTRSGFRELPGIRNQDEARTWADGVWPGDDLAEDRVLSWELLIQENGDAFDQAVLAYERVMVPIRDGHSLAPLWAHIPGRGPVRWDVRCRRHAILDEPELYAIGRARALAQMSAPDPIGYGPGSVASTGFAQQQGGLEFDLFTNGTEGVGYLDFGPAGSTGRNRVRNDGNAPLWVSHRITGPTPTSGFEIVDTTTGRRLRYAGVVPAGSVLDIDTGDGSVTLDGVADRGGALAVREWGSVPAGSSTEFAFLPLSSATGAVMQTAYASAWW